MRPYVKVFIILIGFAILAGCGGETKTDTLTIWHWMSDRDAAFQELGEKFEQETQIKVKFDLYAPSEIYSQRIKASAQTSTLPDIFGILGEKRDFASFIRSGFVQDLTADLEDGGTSSWRSRFFDKALAVNRFEENNEFSVTPGAYGVPLDVTTIQMVYNKSLFEKAGLDPASPPATWEEFVSACAQLKTAGIPRMVSGFGEIWMIDAFSSNLAMNVMGEEKVFATYAGKVPYTDPDWITVLGLFKQMADEGMLAEGAVTMVNKTAEQTFANERAAFAFNGSWSINVYKGMNPNLKYGVMLPPRANTTRPMKIWGGAGGSFVVNAKSPKKAEAIRFLKWLTEKEQQSFLAKATENLPSNKQSLGEISPILGEFADDMENATHPNIYPIHEKAVVSEAFSKGIQSILIGEKTPAQVAADVQKTKEKENKKAA